MVLNYCSSNRRVEIGRYQLGIYHWLRPDLGRGGHGSIDGNLLHAVAIVPAPAASLALRSEGRWRAHLFGDHME